MLRFLRFKSRRLRTAGDIRIGIGLSILVLVLFDQRKCPADTFVSVPTPHGGQTNTIYPFMIQQAGLSSTRYQQVYNQSIFTNGFPYMINSNQIYISTIQLSIGSLVCSYLPWAVSNIQINLSTTSNSADGLSSIFAENVGNDDTIVYGPASLSGDGGPILVQFSRPFRYYPTHGSLLIDVRVFDASGPPPSQLCPYPPVIAAENLPSDESSRVWSTNVNASIADHIDTVGFDTILQFSAVPSLRIYTSYFGTPTNWVAIEWPTQPAVFEFQRSLALRPPFWQKVPTNGFFSTPEYQRYYFPVSTSAPLSYFRLFWSGQ